MNYGLYNTLDNMAMLSDAESRSITAENPNGARAGGGRAKPDPVGTHHAHGIPAREMGQGWKARPYEVIEAGQTFTAADIEGPGCTQSIWMTIGRLNSPRDVIIRIYYDGQDHPSVECPLGDFFASAFVRQIGDYAPLNSLAVCMNPGSGYNCYWPMPFRKHYRMTFENLNPEQEFVLFYQINYSLEKVPEDAAYFHAQFRRTNPLPYARVHTLLDGIEGQGHYAGTYMAWGLNNSGWWGEGEMKFYLDDDIPKGLATDDAVAEHGGECFPTICGTGIEDYFCASYNFENRDTKQYQEYCTPYSGVPQILRPDGVYQSQMRFSMYRWHIPDPIRFKERLAVTVQALGWRSEHRYLHLQDDIASVAYWYQTLPTAPFPDFPTRDQLEIN